MTKTVLAVSVIALMSIAPAARADVITGVLNFTGTAQISLGTIDFVGNEFNINSPASTQQGGFMALEGTTGTIDNITNPPDATGPIVPNETDFMTFAAAPNISFTFTYLLAGIDGAAGCSIPETSAASGQVCTPNSPAESPFNLQNTSATSSSASFDIIGTEVDSITGNTVTVDGAFTTPFSNQNFQQILAEVLAGDTITTSFSAEFNTVSGAPEPSTLVELLLGIGTIGIGMVFRKKSEKQSS